MDSVWVENEGKNDRLLLGKVMYENGVFINEVNRQGMISFFALSLRLKIIYEFALIFA